MLYSQQSAYLVDPSEFSSKLGPTAKVGLRSGNRDEKLGNDARLRGAKPLGGGRIDAQQGK
jgi:hypothetical protein